MFESISDEKERIDQLLNDLKQYRLFDNKVKQRLNNPPQYRDTILEIEVILHIARNDLSPSWGREPPDIMIPDLEIEIEVHNLHESNKLIDSCNDTTAETAPEIDDIYRLSNKIESVVDYFKGNGKINILVIGAPSGFDFDETYDMCIGQGFKVPINGAIDNLKPIRIIDGLFTIDKYSCISGIVLLKNGIYKGIVNPNAQKNIPNEIKRLFKMSNP